MRDEDPGAPGMPLSIQRIGSCGLTLHPFGPSTVAFRHLTAPGTLTGTQETPRRFESSPLIE